MQRSSSLRLAALALVFAAVPGIGQSFQPKAIRFEGAAPYPEQELLGALALTPGSTLSYAEMNRSAQKLVDTGMFASVSFKFDGQDLIFTVTPATGLLPLRLQNLPMHAGKDLDDKLHRQFPLYHGLLPAQGGLTESVRTALEKMLATQGVNASVSAAPFEDAVLQKTTAVNFAVTSPAVLVGDLRTAGAIVALDSRASAIAAKFPGSLYDEAGSPAAIESAFSAYYKDQGYTDPVIHAVASEKPVVSATAIRIPFRVSIAPGAQYKLGSVNLTPNMIVSQADFDRQFHFRAGDVADGERLRAAWRFIEQQYHNRGYIKARVQAALTIDHAQNMEVYNVTVDAGPAYTMGELTIDNVTDDLRSAMLAAWKMPAGSVFNEGGISDFFNTHGVNPALEQIFSGVDYHYTLLPNEDRHTVDVKLALEKKP